MKSIRRRLIIWLLLGLAVLWTAAGAGLYLTVRNSELTRLDAELEKFENVARFLAAFGPREGGSGSGSGGGGSGNRPGRGDRSDRSDRPDREPSRLQAAEERYPDFFREDGGKFFQVWTLDGESRRKSPSLGERDLPFQRIHEGDRSRFFSTELAGGTQVRVKASPSRPPGFGRGPQRRGPGAGSGNQATQPPRMVTAIAIDSSAMRQTLASLLFGIIGVGVLAAFASVALVHFALKSGLEPLRLLGRQVARIDADSLEARFSSKELPIELAPICDRLNALMSRLQASFERERRFSSDLAHELRTPVAELRTTAEVALRWPDGGGKEVAETALEIAEQMGGTIETLLALGRYENGQAEIEPEPVAIAELSRSCWKAFADKAEGRGLEIDFELDESQSIETDPKMLRVILTNLFSNAAEYTPDGGQIAISGASGENGAVLRVANTAPALDEDDIEHLFERFWRHDDARTAGSHCGLGLALARACADTLDLDLAAHLEDGEGLVFDLSKKTAESPPPSSSHNLAALY